MKSIKSITLSSAIGLVFFAVLSSPPAMVHARDGSDSLQNIAAAQSSKQKRKNACLARYRDCLSLKQIPSFECQYIYEDCINHIV
jgi:hypothetical protein